MRQTGIATDTVVATAATLAGGLRDGLEVGSDASLVVTRGEQDEPRSDGKRFFARLHFSVIDPLTDIGLVIAGSLSDPLEIVAAIEIENGSEVLDLGAESVQLTDRYQSRGFGISRDSGLTYAFVAVVPERVGARHEALRLTVRFTSGEACQHVVQPIGNLEDLGDILAAASDRYARDVIERLLRSLADRRVPPRLLSLALRIHRRIDPLDDHGIGRLGPKAECFVDGAIRVGNAGMVVRGWLLHDTFDTVRSVSIVSLSGRRGVMTMPLPAIARPDVLAAKRHEIASQTEDCGFVAFVPLPDLAPDETLWLIELVMERGVVRWVPFTCPPEPAPTQGIEAAVMLAESGAKDLPDLFDRAIRPAVEWFWNRLVKARKPPVEVRYGAVPRNPRVSIIVPLYGRIDFVRHQMANFSNDPDFQGDTGIVDLIYVLDEPSKAAQFNLLCSMLHKIYGLPFRTLVQHQNGGYSAANNAGAAVSAAPLLILLNSDVFPKDLRWVDRLARSYEKLDRCGVLGCRLLFEDDSIQHAGMTFERSLMLNGCWTNNHPNKGLPASFDPVHSYERVPAVTGACMMIERALYLQLGGLSEEYIIGDFEDSDLCLKAQEQGHSVYYTSEVELYHLERQSMQLLAQGHMGWRQSLTLYNMWKHTRRWGGAIPPLLESFEGTAVVS